MRPASAGGRRRRASSRSAATDEIGSWPAPPTRVIDAGGRLVLPGFNDAHVHLSTAPTELVGVDLRPAKDDASSRGAWRRTRRSCRKGRWILGGYWDHEAWPEQRAADAPRDRRRDAGPSRSSSSASTATWRSPTRWRSSSPASRRASQPPTAARSCATASGEPAGVFKDNAMDLVARAIPPDRRMRPCAKARAALAHAASLGVTTIQDMTAGAAELRAYQAAARGGAADGADLLRSRIYDIAPLVQPACATGFGDDWMRIGGSKLFADGSMGVGDGGVLRAVCGRRRRPAAC